MSNQAELPILYSFRRCPYAMRARMALAASGIRLEIREVDLKRKPSSMLEYSPKGEVPVLLLEGEVIDESRDIMVWALEEHDPDAWLNSLDMELLESTMSLVDHNDHEFKPWLDRYKYHVGYPEQTQSAYRQVCEQFLQLLEGRLQQNAFLILDRVTFADIAIFPFIRQFAFVDKSWFDASPYVHLHKWLEHFLNDPRFQRVMKKYPVWKEGSLAALAEWSVTD
jgi:glutathione S-transferase